VLTTRTRPAKATDAVDQNGVPVGNKHAERAIRPAVIFRKISNGNRSERGVGCHVAWLSIFRALESRGDDPLQTTLAAATV